MIIFEFSNVKFCYRWFSKDTRDTARFDAATYFISMKKLIILACLIGLTACAARSKVQLADKQSPRAQGHTEPICMLKSPLPSTVQYRVVGKINSSKRTYGSVNELIPLMAADARAIGADAIINLVTTQKMGAWAWARPVAEGTAVQLVDKSSFNCIASGGELR